MVRYTCPVCKQNWKDGQESIQCGSCLGWVHHNNRRNCSGLTNGEFLSHSQDESINWQCDKCFNSSTTYTLPFNHLDEENWLNFHDLQKNPTSDDVRFLSGEHLDFITQCEEIQNILNFDNASDDILLNHVNSKSFLIDQFNSMKIDIPSSFGLFHANIASLNLHIDDLRLILSRLKYKFDVIGISEHKIRRDAPSKNINITGYKEFVFEPTESTHGGTGFYIKDNIDYVVRKDLQINSPGDFESTFIEIQFTNKKNLIVGCVYRHPTSDISIQDFTNLHLDQLLRKISSENKQCVLMGDFNVDLLKIDTHNGSNEFYNELTSHFFTPYVLQPTRLYSKTLIDNIFFNSLEYQSKSGNLLIEISDHLIQFMILEGYVKERSMPEVRLYKRDFSNFNEREFLETIHSMNWINICDLNKHDPNFSCNNFFNHFTYQLDEFAPFRKVTKKEYELMLKPWISKEILEKCNKRDSILKSISKEKDPTKVTALRNDYKKLRNEITIDKRVSKKTYYSSYFERNKLKSAEIWKGIRSLVNIKPSKSIDIKLLDENNNLISDPRKISNVFNCYFSTLGPEIERTIPIVPGDFKDYLNKRDINGKLFINPSNASFFLAPTVPGEIEKFIDALDIKKSTGPNSIPVFILKSLKPFFAFWISELINLSFEVGIFPDILKLAKITPLHKKECKLNFQNYRPISLPGHVLNGLTFYTTKDLRKKNL